MSGNLSDPEEESFVEFEPASSGDVLCHVSLSHDHQQGELLQIFLALKMHSLAIMRKRETTDRFVVMFRKAFGINVANGLADFFHFRFNAVPTRT